MQLHYDKNGQPLGLFEWATLFEDVNYRVVGQEMVGPYLVSTVWIGLTYPVIPDDGVEKPHGIFETMIFDRESGRPYYDSYCQRYDTLVEAETGHKQAVQAVREIESLDESHQSPESN